PDIVARVPDGSDDIRHSGVDLLVGECTLLTSEPKAKRHAARTGRQLAAAVDVERLDRLELLAGSRATELRELSVGNPLRGDDGEVAFGERLAAELREAHAPSVQRQGQLRDE